MDVEGICELNLDQLFVNMGGGGDPSRVSLDYDSRAGRQGIVASRGDPKERQRERRKTRKVDNFNQRQCSNVYYYFVLHLGPRVKEKNKSRI